MERTKWDCNHDSTDCCQLFSLSKAEGFTGLEAPEADLLKQHITEMPLIHVFLESACDLLSIWKPTISSIWVAGSGLVEITWTSISPNAHWLMTPQPSSHTPARGCFLSLSVYSCRPVHPPSYPESTTSSSPWSRSSQWGTWMPFISRLEKTTFMLPGFFQPFSWAYFYIIEIL